MKATPNNHEYVESLMGKVQGRQCRKCRSRYAVQGHHLIPRGRMRKSPAVDNAANIIPLCHACHQDHHTLGRSGRVSWSVLKPVEQAFVLEHESEHWASLWYPGATS